MEQTRFQLENQLTDAIGRLRPLPGTGLWVDQLQELQGRIQKREKLVAVFGAFSAGKSSLINALLGDHALVVSPNPTTAAVTHVQAARTAEAASARVTAKTGEQLWDDVQLALNHIHKTSASLEDAVALCQSLRIPDFAPSARKHAAFLKAVADGYPEMAHRLGTSWDITETDLRRFTAEERYACFIHRVDLAHHAHFLQDGITLVDTPGVDSIHRRHTDVAFHYMRSADAIVFVLYYTHAFSRADKDFLSQLADVQDVVGTDKLFVVINAVDLATSDEERHAVRERVERELRQLGVRTPRVFELSSQLSFAASQLQNDPSDTRFHALVRQRMGLADDAPLPNLEVLQETSGVLSFSRTLREWVIEQSSALAQEAVARRLQTIGDDIEQVYQRKVEQGSADEDARRAWHEARLKLAGELRGNAGSTADAIADARRTLEAEWDELTYHMGERIRLRYVGLFREAFHPGRFRGGSDRLHLQDAAQEFTDVLSRQIDAECRTFALRGRAQAQKAFVRWQSLLRERLQETHAERALVPVTEDDVHWPVAELPRRANMEWESLRPFFRYFSSPKQFFEGGGQQQMLNESESTVLALVRREISSLTAALRAETVARLQSMADSTAEAVVQELVQPSMDAPDALELQEWKEVSAWFKAAL